MVRVPDDPTKAQAWLWGTPPDLEMELYIPRGAKGEPGGWAASTVITPGTSLNDVVTSGLYLNPQSNVANGPSNSTNGGHLEVIAAASWVYQRYTPIAEHRETYVRHRTSGSTWSAWAVYNATRVDQTAGRVIYQWDDLNNRDQLIYGDTGVRNIYTDQAWIDALTGTGVTLNASGLTRVRRVGQIVELVVVIDKPASGSVTCTSAIPLGFRPGAYWNALAVTSSIGLSRVYHPGGASPIIHQSQAAQMNATFSVTYTTNDAWPTALPGVASGSIPNL